MPSAFPNASGAGRWNDLDVDAVDVEEIDARGDVALNDLGTEGFHGFRQRGALGNANGDALSPEGK